MENKPLPEINTNTLTENLLKNTPETTTSTIPKTEENKRLRELKEREIRG